MKLKSSIPTFAVVLGLCLPAFSLSGCAPLFLAGIGAVAGYAVSRDSVTVDLDRPYNRAWAAALEETKRQGRLKKEDPSRGRIDARVRESDVVITLEQLTDSTVRVVVRARQKLLPKIDIAQKLGVAIARRSD